MPNLHMLWQVDDAKRPLSEEIQAGLDAFKRAWGCDPVYVQANPGQVPETVEMAGVQVRPSPYATPGHLLFVKEELKA